MSMYNASSTSDLFLLGYPNTVLVSVKIVSLWQRDDLGELWGGLERPFENQDYFVGSCLWAKRRTKMNILSISTYIAPSTTLLTSTFDVKACTTCSQLEAFMTLNILHCHDTPPENDAAVEINPSP